MLREITKSLNMEYEDNKKLYSNRYYYQAQLENYKI